MLSEPVAIPDVYASSLSHVEDLGDGNYRFTFCVRQLSTYGGDEHVIVTRLIMPGSAVYAAMQQTMKAMGHACCGAGRMKDRH